MLQQFGTAVLCLQLDLSLVFVLQDKVVIECGSDILMTNEFQAVEKSPRIATCVLLEVWRYDLEGIVDGSFSVERFYQGSLD